jgi:hypothetical protein
MLIFDLPNWIISFTVLGTGMLMWAVSIVVMLMVINIFKEAIIRITQYVRNK